MKKQSIASSSRFALFLAALWLGAVATPGLAKDAKVSGLGLQSCATWASWKLSKSGELRAMTIEWAHGFIAGHNIYSAVTNDSQNSVVVDSKILTALLDSFCEKYPEQRVLNAVADIVQSLGGAKINVAPKVPGASGAPGAPGNLGQPGQPRPLTPEQRKQKGTSL